ncbi:unnamed protein product [Alternaria alternata]
MLTDSAFSNTFQPASSFTGANKLDFLASAVQSEILRPSTSNLTVSSSASAARAQTEAQACICKWQHAPGVLCLAVFDAPEALHRHIKTGHVDNCTHCFCQWEGCEAHSKDFKQRSKLSRHLLGHAGYRPYACSYEGCEKTFATNQAKDNHERTHTGERPYTLRPYRCPHPNCTFKPDCRWENLKRHLRRSSHCPQLLVETSEEYKSYREGVRREIDDWHKRNEDGGLGKAGRRKGRA